MVLTSAAFILAGIACIGLSGYTLYAVSPKDGKPPTFWTRTEARSTTLALALVTAFVIGGGLMLKGILS
ncbi:MAG: hypothetical protein WD775_07810 [Burkholderiales bacterium]